MVARALSPSAPVVAMVIMTIGPAPRVSVGIGIALVVAPSRPRRAAIHSSPDAVRWRGSGGHDRLSRAGVFTRECSAFHRACVRCRFRYVALPMCRGAVTGRSILVKRSSKHVERGRSVPLAPHQAGPDLRNDGW